MLLNLLIVREVLGVEDEFTLQEMLQCCVYFIQGYALANPLRQLIFNHAITWLFISDHKDCELCFVLQEYFLYNLLIDRLYCLVVANEANYHQPRLEFEGFYAILVDLSNQLIGIYFKFEEVC